MIVGRIVGFVLLLVALGAFGYEVVSTVSAGGYRLVAAAELWFRVDGNSLVGFQALIEKRVSPWLWNHIVLPILTGPSWAIPLVPAAILLAACWPRRRKRGLFAHR